MTETERTAINPAHYKDLSPEPIVVIQAWDLGFEAGNAVKYLARAGRKAGVSAIEDLGKAKRYLEMKIESTSPPHNMDPRRYPERVPSAPSVLRAWGLGYELGDALVSIAGNDLRAAKLAVEAEINKFESAPIVPAPPTTYDAVTRAIYDARACAPAQPFYSSFRSDVSNCTCIMGPNRPCNPCRAAAEDAEAARVAKLAAIDLAHEVSLTRFDRLVAKKFHDRPMANRRTSESALEEALEHLGAAIVEIEALDRRYDDEHRRYVHVVKEGMDLRGQLDDIRRENDARRARGG